MEVHRLALGEHQRAVVACSGAVVGLSVGQPVYTPGEGGAGGCPVIGGVGGAGGCPVIGGEGGAGGCPVIGGEGGAGG